MQRALLLLVVVAFIPRAAAAQGDPLGPEFRVNTFTTRPPAPSVHRRRIRPATSSSSGAATTQDGSASGIFGQRYASAGGPWAPSSASTPTRRATRLSVRGLRRHRQLRRRLGERPGRLVAGVFGQRYASSGAPLGAEFRVNTYTTNAQRLSIRRLRFRRQLRRRLGQLRTGRFELWHLRPALRQFRRTPWLRVPSQHLYDDLSDLSVRRLGHHRQLRRRLDERFPGRLELRRLRPALRQLRRTPRPGVPGQHLYDGHSVRCVGRLRFRRQLRRRLDERRTDGSNYGVFGQRFASSGTPLGPEFRVNTYTTHLSESPVRRLGHRRQLRRRLEQRLPGRLGLRRLRPALRQLGAPLGAEFRVNTYTTDGQIVRPSPRTPPATLSSSGRATTRTARDSGVFGQRYSQIVPVELMHFRVE